MNDQGTKQTPAGLFGSFNTAEWHALSRIRESYHPGHDYFTPAELAHLEFVRWLHQTGRSAS